MKITIETPNPGEEDEIIIRVANLTEDVLSTIKALKDGNSKDCVAVNYEDSIHMLPIKEILYFDGVDNKVFAYTKDRSYEIKMKLYEIEADSSFSSFLRISKNTIANIKKINHLSPEFNGRFVAKLTNGESLIISRGYVPALKKKLGIVK
ncbi:MAG: LytTR family transcriptional regulator DNA-binding domain-containing protein [Lachnospiraceae bacterium]|nr:LytTR family transcriptional regulator DNA-binding domain-containing protein [Lachnospiraceae bacterium]